MKNCKIHTSGIVLYKQKREQRKKYHPMWINIKTEWNKQPLKNFL